MKKLLVCLLLVLSLTIVTIASEHKACISRCLKKTDHSELCSASCDFHQTLPNLEVFVDGMKIEPKVESEANVLADNSFNANNVNFDRNFYNTPGAFSDILEFKGQLMNEFYNHAAHVFRTPGHDYKAGAMLHVLNVPIPLTDAQFNNQEFMNKLIDIVPKSQQEYDPVSRVPLSDTYREFLLGVKVDPAHVSEAPSSPAVQAHIKQKEDQLEHILNEYMGVAQRCFDAYQNHIVNQNLSPISYTMEEYTKINGECQHADAKLAEHDRLSKELSGYLQSLNPYNELFTAIAKVSNHHHNWNYAKDQIQQFVNHHRNMERQGVVPADSKFSIPATVKRNSFNHRYFGGNSATFSEENIDSHLTFSGLGWKECQITPDASWFDMYSLQKYRSHPQNYGKNYFGENGLLHRIPSFMLVAYKPELKIKISRQMKDGFSNTASTHQLRPIESGPLVFTKVDIRTNEGGRVNEEYEMVLSANIDQPQIIAFRSTPVVHVPAGPAPPQPAYIRFFNKRVVLRSVHNTFLRVAAGGDGASLTTSASAASEDTWVVRNAGENKVVLMSTHGTYLRCHAGGDGSRADASANIGDWEKFTIIESNGRWGLRSVHGTYLRMHGGVGGGVDCTPNFGDWEKYSIETQTTPLWLEYMNRRVVFRAHHGGYLVAPGGEGARVGQSGNRGAHETWRIVYTGQETVALLSAHGTYLRGPPDQYIQHKKRRLFSTKRWTEHIPSRAIVASGIDDCTRFRLEPAAGGTVTLRTVCEGRYIQAINNGEVGLNAGVGDWERFVLQPVTNFNEFHIQIPTIVPSVDANQHDFLVADNGDLFMIKKYHTGTRKTEVHVLSEASNYQQYILQVGTAFEETNENYEFALAQNRDLFIFKKAHTGTRSTEIHVLSAASNYQQFVLQTGTVHHECGKEFQMFVEPVSRDMMMVKKTHTGTKSTEVFTISAASGYKSFTVATGTKLEETDDSWQFTIDEDRNVIGVKRIHTGTGKTEVHVLSARNTYQAFSLQTGSALPVEHDANRFKYVYANKKLYGILKYGSGTGKVEVHALSA